MDHIALLMPANEVAKSLTDYLTQAFDRVYPKLATRPRPRRRGPAWFNQECKERRGEAVRVSERAETTSDFEYLNKKTKGKNIAMTDPINDNFTVDEIRNSIRELKNNKSTGQDHIPAEFVRICNEDAYV